MSIETVFDSDEYTEINIGKMCELSKFENGKVFVQKATKATSCEISLNVFQPGQAYPFFHSHKTHEEIYICLGGEGEIQLNDKILRFGEGDIVRVAPCVSRSIKNTGSCDLLFVCSQSVAGTFTEIAGDCQLEQTEAKFSK